MLRQHQVFWVESAYVFYKLICAAQVLAARLIYILMFDRRMTWRIVYKNILNELIVKNLIYKQWLFSPSVYKIKSNFEMISFFIFYDFQ